MLTSPALKPPASTKTGEKPRSLKHVVTHSHCHGHTLPLLRPTAGSKPGTTRPASGIRRPSRPLTRWAKDAELTAAFPARTFSAAVCTREGIRVQHANMKRSTVRLQHIHDKQKYCSPSATSPSQYIIHEVQQGVRRGVPVATEPSCRHWCDALQSGDAFPLPPPRPALPQAQPLEQAWRKARVEGAHNG